MSGNGTQYRHHVAKIQMETQRKSNETLQPHGSAWKIKNKYPHATRHSFLKIIQSPAQDSEIILNFDLFE
jgi:hypothetical protein